MNSRISHDAGNFSSSLHGLSMKVIDAMGLDFGVETVHEVLVLGRNSCWTFVRVAFQRLDAPQTEHKGSSGTSSVRTKSNVSDNRKPRTDFPGSVDLYLVSEACSN